MGDHLKVRLLNPLKRLSQRNKVLFWMLVPCLAFIFILTIYPTVYLLFVSLTSYNTMEKGSMKFIGLANFGTFLTDANAWHAFWISMKHVVVTLSLELVLGTLTAIAAYKLLNKWYSRWLRTIVLLPLMVPSVVTGITWAQLFSPTNGFFSYLASKFGLYSVGFLGDASTAFSSLVAIDVWQWTPFIFLMILAGLEALPAEPYEAASIDGAGRTRTFWSITIPLLKRNFLITIILKIIFSFKVWAEIYMTTRGGPGNLTETLNVHIFNVAFVNNNFGYAGALSFVYLIILNVILLAFFKALFPKNAV
ncbi:carbohydrate ABC transporter permease [Cohnella terricola]|uniref:carbohydrate ABC transporter permease n=1 Tax=Cohnella terricola TaxID=1289167 RepID=UPI0016464C8E|nr:sugar ABC transporter permease [Cohnella terricola]